MSGKIRAKMDPMISEGASEMDEIIYGFPGGVKIDSRRGLSPEGTKPQGPPEKGPLSRYLLGRIIGANRVILRRDAPH